MILAGSSSRAEAVRLAVGGLVALAAAMGIGRFVYTPILPFMAEDLGLGGSQAGLIASANFAGYLAGALVAAVPGLPGSRRAWLLGALIVSGITTAAMAIESTMVPFLMLRFLGGMASAFVLVYASTLVLERLYTAGRGGLSSAHFGGVGAGIALSAALVSSLAAFGYGWRWHWIASGALTLGAVWAVAALIPNHAEPAIPPARNTGRGGLAPLIAAYGLYGFGYVITATFLVAIVRGAAEIAPLEPMIWVLVGVAAAPSVAFWGWVGAEMGTLRAFALANVLEAIGVGASVRWIAPMGAMLAAVLLGGTFMGIAALGLVSARSLASGDPRRVLALMTAAFGLGQIIGPVLAGFLHDLTGSFLAASLAASAALVLAAVLALRVRAPA